MNSKLLKKLLKTIATIFSIIICTILVIIIILNISLWVHQKFDKNAHGKIFGVYPLIVESNSMSPIFCKGDLIFSKPLNPGEVVVGDIISFENIYSNKRQIVTHRINNIFYENGVKKFTTKGDSNSYNDAISLDSNFILGKYIGKIPKLGGIIELIRQPLTLILILTIIILAYVLAYILSRIKNQKKEKYSNQ